MPTYEYECDACKHKFDEFQSMSDPKLKKCPKCGKSKLRRLFGTGAAVIFKGSGFYQTDYRSKSYQDAAKAEKDSSSPKTEGNKAEGKTDSASGKEAKTSGDSGTESTSTAESGGSGKKGTGKSPAKKAKSDG